MPKMMGYSCWDCGRDVQGTSKRCWTCYRKSRRITGRCIKPDPPDWEKHLDYLASLAAQNKSLFQTTDRPHPSIGKSLAANRPLRCTVAPD